MSKGEIECDKIIQDIFYVNFQEIFLTVQFKNSISNWELDNAFHDFGSHLALCDTGI